MSPGHIGRSGSHRVATDGTRAITQASCMVRSTRAGFGGWCSSHADRAGQGHPAA
jgi:hypothetical protein